MLRPSIGSIAAGALCAGLVSGCASDFLPASYLNDLRVLAILAEPLEVGPGQPVTLRPALYVPPGATLTSTTWTFCPVSAGSVAAYACAAPQCQVTLVPAADGSVTANPYDLAIQCLAASGGGLPPATLPGVVQTVFRLEVEAGQGERREAVLQIPLYPAGVPADPNLAPAIRSVEIGGVAVYPPPGSAPPGLAPGGTLPVHVVVDPASAQPYVDAAGVARVETVTVSYFTTAGRFADDRSTGLDVGVDLQGTDLGPADASADVWVAVRDLRGGQALAGPFRVAIGP
jgi:hypothetical protein